MSSRTIMVVDDEPRMRSLLRDFLRKDGYTVLEAGDGGQALDLFYHEQGIDLIILDVMMPVMDGWQVLQEIRRESQVPVIMLTARTDERDELRGFSLGVDEYVSKPFSPRTLMARVGAILRRAEGGSAQNTLECGGIVLRKDAHTVTVDGEPVNLSFKEFELLNYFMENKGIALTREKILNKVWNYDFYGDARTIDTHVKMLRGKLGDAGRMIHTVRGLGYKFDDAL